MSGSQVGRQKWEYARLTMKASANGIMLFAAWSTNLVADNVELRSDVKLDDCLARMGENGWELVAVIDRDGQTTTYFIFKRRKP